MAVPISNVTRRQVYAPSGAGGAGPYAFTFEILANTDIAVYKDDTLLTLTTHYTVVINANGTGSVTITAAGLALAPASPTQYAIVGNRTIARTSDFTTGGDFFANTLNDELDQQTIFAQQNAEGVARSLAAPQTDPTSINMTLPRASLRANKALGFDASGNPVISDTLGTNRGNWAAGTLYYVRDIVKDTTNNNIWQVITQHTSSGSQPINTNADAAKWTLLVDAASATTSATNAAASASAASTSASNASTSASNASTSASAASALADSAYAHASAAATSASNAAASYDSFDDRYLGTKASDPTVDNDGNALIDGALYFDTTNNVMKVYDLGNTTWRRTTPTTSDQSNINAVNSNSTNINTVAGISANVTTVATNSANVTTVAGSIASVNTNATNIANINQNAANIVAIQNASANATAAASSATAAAGSATSAASSAAAASAVVLGNEPVRPAIRPSLLLDFANAKQLDPRITFTRASTASYYDGVTTAKAEENLLVRSQEFDNASWGKSNVTVTGNALASPDGTTTAESMVGDGVSTFHLINQSITALVSGNSYVLSVFAKANGLNFVQLMTSASADGRANFDITSGAGAIGTVSGAFSGATITDAGNGWFRCAAVVSGSVANFFQIGLISGTTAARAESFATSSGAYLWGAQLEQRSAVTAYTATTTQPITNYIPKLQTAASGVARFDHNPTTGESLGLLIEEQRTNICLRSEDFSASGWALVNTTVSNNVGIAPDGTQTADLLIPNSTSSADHSVYRLNGTLTGTYTASCYAKAAGYNFVDIFDGTSANRLRVNLADGSYTIIGSPAAISVTAVGNGWYRCSFTRAISSALQFVQVGVVSNSAGSAFSGNDFGGVLIWGAQQELGAFATSYIPTVASQVTRAADAASMTGTNFSSWFNASEGTLYVDAIADATASAASRFVNITNASAIVQIDIYRNAGNVFGYILSSGATQANINLGSVASQSSFKAALAYKTNDVAGSNNGAAVVTDTSAILPVIDRMWIGSLSATSQWSNSPIKKIAYYPLRVTNAQLQGMTTV